ncbi:hypothetical protein GUJ93_ZPchr0616g33694 [Zizania palustris]|uniref:Uncharacterized protein n=1 Tax=Zizania palustris TaxID=103762 RepID=A0A8J5QYF5_ZIZPA|nr:hypothetical protein GUJ93_ZPchr0616g33694 [Zizania palustris]
MCRGRVSAAGPERGGGAEPPSTAICALCWSGAQARREEVEEAMDKERGARSQVLAWVEAEVGGMEKEELMAFGAALSWCNTGWRRTQTRCCAMRWCWGG